MSKKYNEITNTCKFSADGIWHGPCSLGTLMKHLLQPLAMISLLIAFTACPGNSIVEGILSGAGIDGAVTQDTTGASTTDGTTNAESDEEGEDAAAASSDSSDAWLEEYFSDAGDTDYSGVSVDDNGATGADDSIYADDTSATAGTDDIPSDASADASTGSNDAFVATADDIPTGGDAVADADGGDTGSDTSAEVAANDDTGSDTGAEVAVGEDTGSDTGAEVAVGEDTGSTTGDDAAARTGSGATEDDGADSGVDYDSPVMDSSGMVAVGPGIGKLDEEDNCTEAERVPTSNTDATHYMRVMPDNGRGRWMSMGVFGTSFTLSRSGGEDDGGDSGTAFDQFSGLSIERDQTSGALTKVGLTTAQVQLFGSATDTDTATGGLSGIATDFKGVYFGIQGEIEAPIPTCTVDTDDDGVGDKVISATGIFKNLRVVGSQTAADGTETKFQVKVKDDGSFTIKGGMLEIGAKFDYQIVNLKADTLKADTVADEDSRITVGVQKGLQLDLTVGKGTSTDTSDASDAKTLSVHFYPEWSGKQFSKRASTRKGGVTIKGKTTSSGTATDSATDTATATDTAATDDATCKVCELKDGVKSSPTKVKTDNNEEGYGFLENTVLVLTK